MQHVNVPRTPCIRAVRQPQPDVLAWTMNRRLVQRVARVSPPPVNRKRNIDYREMSTSPARAPLRMSSNSNSQLLTWQSVEDILADAINMCDHLTMRPPVCSDHGGVFLEPARCRRNFSSSICPDTYFNSGGAKGATIWPMEFPRVQRKYFLLKAGGDKRNSRRCHAYSIFGKAAKYILWHIPPADKSLRRDVWCPPGGHLTLQVCGGLFRQLQPKGGRQMDLNQSDNQITTEPAHKKARLELRTSPPVPPIGLYDPQGRRNIGVPVASQLANAAVEEPESKSRIRGSEVRIRVAPKSSQQLTRRIILSAP